MRGNTYRRLRIRLPQLVAGLALWVVVGVTVWSTAGMPYQVEGSPGPRFMPLLLAAFLAVLSLLYWAESFRRDGGDDVSFPPPAELVRPAGFVLVALLMVLLWERLGAVLTVMLVSFLELKLLEGYSWPRSLVMGLAMSTFTWLLFQVVLGIPLPGGVLGWLLVP